jgi:hypothetical protein
MFTSTRPTGQREWGIKTRQPFEPCLAYRLAIYEPEAYGPEEGKVNSNAL